MKPNLLTAKADGDRELAINAQSTLLHSDLERPRIDRLNESVAELVVQFEKAPYVWYD